MDNSTFVIDCDTDIDLKQNGELEKQKKHEQHQQQLQGTREHAYAVEDAISLIPIGKFHYRLLITCGLCFMSVMIQIICVSVILPFVKCDLPATLSEQGFLASAGFLGVVMSSHAMGFLADTWGRLKTLKWSLILSTLASAVSSFSVNIWMLIVFRFLTGFFISGCQACVFSLCGEYHSDRTRGKHVTLLSVFLPFSMIYMPTIAIFTLPYRIEFALFGVVMSSWRILLLANLLVPILAVIGLYFMPETPKYQLMQGDHEGALKALSNIFALNTGRSEDEYPVKSLQLNSSGANIKDIHSIMDAVKMIWSQTVPLFYKERVLQTLNICAILFAFYGISHGIFMWLPTIMNDLIAKNGENVCVVISAAIVEGENAGDVCTGEVSVLNFIILIFIGVAFTSVYLVFSFTINVVGKKNLIFITLAICTLCCVFVHWITKFSLAILVLTLITSVGNCGGIVSTISVDYFPTNINAMSMCFTMMIGRLGAVAGSNIIGQVLFDYCDDVFWILTGAMIVLGVMCWFLPDDRKRVECKEKEIK